MDRGNKKEEVEMNELREERYEKTDYTGFACFGCFRPRLNRKYTRSEQSATSWFLLGAEHQSWEIAGIVKELSEAVLI